MKLYLHIGTEKTGSSFIQYYFANHRTLLRKHNIYYPTAGKREADMLAGRISPGNAWVLNEYLNEGNWQNVKKWMTKKHKEASNLGVEKLLLSNEILVKSFSKAGVLHKFIDMCQSIGFQMQEMILIIREPVSQALSLYKHRSKRGDMMPIQEWLKEKYILADCLGQFYKVIDAADIQVQQYPYQKDSQYLIKRFFKSWLGIEEDIQVNNTIINPSLTLSELALQSKIKAKDSFLARCYYDKMISVNAAKKANDINLKNYISIHINNYMSNYNNLWIQVNQKMNGTVKLFQYKQLSVVNLPSEVSFSESQINALIEYINNIGSLKFLIQKWKETVKERIVKLIH